MLPSRSIATRWKSDVPNTLWQPTIIAEINYTSLSWCFGGSVETQSYGITTTLLLYYDYLLCNSHLSIFGLWFLEKIEEINM
ncbi:hypothetical protein P8452_72793 [Trifolium repens]|nr:hypothetical protein P8452_72793 [Trifolium repens]